MAIVNDTLAVIGAGNMGEAIIAGMLHANRIRPDQVVCADQSDERLAVMRERYGVHTATTVEAIAAAAVVLLAVKPQNVSELLTATGTTFTAEQTVVTIVAGVPISVYENAISAPVSLIRAMPNTPAQLGVGVTALAAAPTASPSALVVAEEIFGSVGHVVVVNEEQLDAVTAVSGSGPAYVFLFAEALTDAGVTAGLDVETAQALAIATLHGSGVMLRESGHDPATLREMVSSPGGTTVAALASFGRDGFHDVVTRAVLAAKLRAAELAAQAR
jgi:pyrroline-5-carboxylate reductase